MAVALTALAQAKIELDGILHSILEIFSSYTKLSGVFGNPLFIGPYLLFHFFYGLYFIAGKNKQAGTGAAAATESAFHSRRSGRYAITLGVIQVKFLF